MILSETLVVKYVTKHLENKNWKVLNKNKGKHAHGADIIAHSPKGWNKKYIIEAKGDTSLSKEQAMHNGMYTVIGQIVLRMSKRPEKSVNQSVRYGIAIPATWKNTLRNKILRSEAGWKLLKLRIFLVYTNGRVKEETHLQFLKLEN